MNQDPTILEELNRLSQHVAALPKHPPYSVPSGFFDQFPEKIRARITKHEALEELSSISPFLSQLDKTIPYDLPEHYFETPRFHKVAEPINHTGKVIRFRQWFTYAAAASVLIVMTLGIVTQNDTASDQMTAASGAKTFPLDSISPEVYSAYLTEAETMELSVAENIPQENAPSLLTDMSSSTVKELLEEIPENDIHLFMDQAGIEEHTTTEETGITTNE